MKHFPALLLLRFLSCALTKSNRRKFLYHLLLGSSEAPTAVIVTRLFAVLSDTFHSGCLKLISSLLVCSERCHLYYFSRFYLSFFSFSFENCPLSLNKRWNQSNCTNNNGNRNDTEQRRVKRNINLKICLSWNRCSEVHDQRWLSIFLRFT